MDRIVARKDELLKNSKIKVQYHGVGHHGYTTSTMLSALQMGVRRNNNSLVEFILNETYLYKTLGCLVKKKSTSAAKAFNTNVVNRLYIIAVEDCSPRALLATNRCMLDLCNYAASDFSNGHFLLRAGRYLTECPSSRVCSHLRQMCGENLQGRGLYYNAFNAYEKDSNTKFSVDDRLRIIFDGHIRCGRKREIDEVELRGVRAMTAFHTLKVYYELSEMDDGGNLLMKNAKGKNVKRHLTPAGKKRKFATFWELCFAAIAYLSTVDEYVAKYELPLQYGTEWRFDFFTSKGYFKEENLFMLSVVDLLIAVVHGPRENGFDVIQKQCQNLVLVRNKDFDWVRDHEKIDPVPRYVFDKDTSNPDPSVSFALESSHVEGGDISWTPTPWLMAYTFARMDTVDDLGAVALTNYELAKLLIKNEVSINVEAIPERFFGGGVVVSSVVENSFQIPTPRNLETGADGLARKKTMTKKKKKKRKKNPLLL